MGEKQTGMRRMPAGWVYALGVALMLAIAAVAIGMIVNQNPTAQAVAEEYFEALAAGDASTALSLTEGYDPDPDPESRDPEDGPDLLTDEVLAAAVELISDVAVVPADDLTDEHDQKVEVSYTLAGERHTFPLTLKRVPTNRYLIPQRFGQWTSFPSYGPDTLTVAGVPVHSGIEPAPGVWFANSAAWTQIFPAVYPVAAVDPTYLDVAMPELVVTGVGLVPDVEVVPTQQLVAELQEWSDQWLDNCVEYSPMAESSARDCPLYVHHPAGTAVIGAWEILEYPTVEVGQFGGQYFADARHGRAAFTPIPEEGGGGPIEMTQEVALRAGFAISDGEVELLGVEDRRREP